MLAESGSNGTLDGVSRPPTRRSCKADGHSYRHALPRDQKKQSSRNGHQCFDHHGIHPKQSIITRSELAALVPGGDPAPSLTIFVVLLPKRFSNTWPSS